MPCYDHPIRMDIFMSKGLSSLMVGDKIWLNNEKGPYKIRARSTRFLICTKPYNPKHTVLYTIIDLRDNIRGTENLVFGLGAETDEQCRQMACRLEVGDDTGRTSISHRNNIPLKVTKIWEQPFYHGIW